MNGYIKSLDGVRAVAIILVMTFHAELNLFGWLGVQLFFVLSGFLITGILWKEKSKEGSLGFKFRNFWIRRSLRIFPLYFGYLIILGVCYLLVKFPSYYPLYAPYLFTYTFNFIRTIPEWQGNPLFTHLWSLCVEEQFYIVYPFLIFLLPRKVIPVVLMTVIFLAPLIRYLLGAWYALRGAQPEVMSDAVYWNTLSHLDAFFMGGLIPVLSLDKRIKNAFPLFILALVVAIGAGVANYLTSGSEASYFAHLGYAHGGETGWEHVWHFTALNFLFASGILVLIKAQQNPATGIRKILEHPWLVRIGQVSYGMYIFHWLILVYICARFMPDNIYLRILSFLPYLALVYAVSELSYRLYEKKFLVLKDKWTKREGKHPVIAPES
jgi:peptidoglycan/LPS O-acetylase OafA/YrhL